MSVTSSPVSTALERFTFLSYASLMAGKESLFCNKSLILKFIPFLMFFWIVADIVAVSFRGYSLVAMFFRDYCNYVLLVNLGIFKMPD